MAGAPLLRQQAERTGSVQPEEEMALGIHYHFPVPKGDYRRAGEGLLTRVCSDRTKENGFKLKKTRFRY